jgi:predicted esterase
MDFRRRLIKQMVWSAWLGMVLLPCVLQGQTEKSLEELVHSYLWPNSEQEFQEAQAVLENDKTLTDVSRERFHDLEEILRRGRIVYPAAPEALDGKFPLQEIMVELSAGEKIPVFVQLPPDYNTDISWPLMFAMHGGPPGSAEGARSSARRMINVWTEAAANAGWIVAAPSMDTAVSRGRRTQDQLPYEIFHEEQIQAVLFALREHYRINPDRIVSTGISLGSNFSIALACAHPDWLSAIVPVSTEGDSRELILRNLATVPAYILEGSRDRNIWGIGGPQALRDIVAGFGYDLTYREFSDRAHEGFQDHYDDVLRWLDGRARDVYPEKILRVPHTAIMPISRRIQWIETDTRQALLRVKVVSSSRIDITARWARKIKVFLHDRLVNLDKPIEIWINGEKVFSQKVNRSILTALEQTRDLGDERRIYAAEVTVKMPTSSNALKEAQILSQEMTPQYPESELSFWERYAVRDLQDRFPHLGFEGIDEKIPAAIESMPEQAAIRITEIDQKSAFSVAGLKKDDILLEVGGEPFFQNNNNPGLLYQWLIRELRTQPQPYLLLVWREGQLIRFETQLMLGPN